MTVELLEAAAPLAPVGRPQRQPDGTLKFRARLIEGERWGSSAYYPADVIKRDGPGVFPVGTKMFADHPGASEKWDRPERSIRDLAGKVASAPVYEAVAGQPQGLYADVVVHAHAADLIESMWSEIGLSIRAEAEVETGERAGRSGRIVTRLAEGTSVDFVTTAGAGGALVSLLESARSAAAVPRTALAEALPGGLTFDDLRAALRELVRATVADVDAYASLADFTDEHVLYRVVDYSTTGGHRESTWRQSYAAASTGGLELTGEAEQVRQVTTWVSVPAGDPAATTLPTSPRTTTVVGSEAAAVAEADHPTATPGGTPVGTVPVEESEYAALRADRERIAAIEAENTRLRGEQALAQAQAAARPIATQLLAESATIPASWQLELVEEAVSGAALTGDLRLDETALRARVGALRTRDERRVASIAEANGAGTVTGLGGGTTAVVEGAVAGAAAGAAAAVLGQTGGGEQRTVHTQESARAAILAARGKGAKTTATTGA